MKNLLLDYNDKFHVSCALCLFPKQRNEQDLQTMQLTQEKFVIDYQTKEQLRGESLFKYKDKIKKYRPGLVLARISATLHF